MRNVSLNNFIIPQLHERTVTRSPSHRAWHVCLCLGGLSLHQMHHRAGDTPSQVSIPTCVRLRMPSSNWGGECPAQAYLASVAEVGSGGGIHVLTT